MAVRHKNPPLTRLGSGGRARLWEGDVRAATCFRWVGARLWVGDLRGRYLFPFGWKISSIRSSKIWAILKASGRLGSYLLVSIALTV